MGNNQWDFPFFNAHTPPKLRLAGFFIGAFNLKKPTKFGASGNFFKGANDKLTLWVSDSDHL